MTLQDFFRENPKAALAFSGGADSAYLLWAASQWAVEVKAYYVRSPFQPAFELADARRLAEELHMPMTVLEADVLSVPGAGMLLPVCMCVLFLQNHIEVADVQAVFPHPLYFDFIPVHRQLRQRPAQIFLGRAQIKQGRHRHIAADSRAALQI